MTSRFAWGAFGQSYRSHYWSEEAFATAEAVKQLADREGLTPSQVAVAWLLSRPGVASAVVGASSPEQLRDSAAGVGAVLSAESITELEALTFRFVSRDPAENSHCADQQGANAGWSWKERICLCSASRSLCSTTSAAAWSHESAERDYGIVINDGEVAEVRRDRKGPRPVFDRATGLEVLRKQASTS